MASLNIGPYGEINVDKSKILEFVRTIEGEVIPRGPVGRRSVFTTPKGRIINMDLEGLPL